MESWDVIVLGAGPAALRAAIACADSGTVPLMIDESGIGSASGASPLAGLAASIDELDSSAHFDDTIAAGGETTDSEAAARTCGEGVSTLAELERWGLVLRRRQGGLPHASTAPGHSVARLTGCGDSTVREVTRVLEEQAIKRGVHRRSDTLPLQLVSDNQQVRGVITLDILTGEVKPIQAKAVILATEGHQGLWSSSTNGHGTGSALALAAGIQLRGLGSIPRHPLTIRDCEVHIPLEVLGSGGRIRREDGEDVGPEEVLAGESCVLDLRGMDPGSKLWFSQTASRVKDRIGIDLSRDVIPISAGVAATTGGAPSDEFGRVTFEGFTPEGLPGKMWFTGLYAAGRSSHNGMHGEGMLSGNLLLDDLVSGKATGTHAAGWSREIQFGGSSQIGESGELASKRIESLQSPNGMPVGQSSSSLASVMCSVNGANDAAARDSIREIRAAGIRVTDNSPVMNTELVSALQLEGMISIAEAIVDTG
ncbi:MAG: FAD-binding protein [Candidatus Thalassarchaeaceae archaeon]|nr:FAD-binding protein [Candidatus Thalassarchaeaceae archaeon]MDP7257575.1 FAD-binding protein [Candidatus Thalassarchaeaceae archaeon]MDP7445977.1 FAD-binding protein [Candidatus Thalassarchaeaceae archaeon]MDP7648951.1 FAD-binding protein [Candidatus Thalassarchaeaceae archaeon]HJM77462.1 FAD-binding protein [Candidatus Thalassarchaeaceae archaeon]